MSNNRDLLKEAIADAKSVKETAIANAKLALEEAFTPHLKSMMSAKLEEMDREDDVKEMKKYEEDDVKKEEMDSKKKRKDMMDEEMKNYDEDDIKKEEMKKKYSEDDVKSEMYKKYEEDDVKSEMYKKYEEDDVKSMDEEMMDSKKKKVDEIDLDELLAELDEEMSKAEMEKVDRDVDAVRDDLDQISKLAKDAGEDAEDIKDKLDEDARTDAEEEGYLDGMKDEKEDMDDKMDDMEIDLDDLSEDDLKGYIETVIKDMVEAGELEPGDEFVEDDVEIEDVEDVDVDVEIDEAKEDKMKKEEMSNPVMRRGDDEKKGGKFKPESAPMQKTEKMRKMEEDLESAIKAVNELKVELTEVNLLNAKLLYTNKIFKSKNLTESKKVKVLKAFDKAKDVKQAKTIFETLNEGIIDTSPINESRIKGSASQITGKAPVTNKQPIVESDAMVARFKKLAGII